MHFHNLFLNFSNWYPEWVLPQLEGPKTGWFVISVVIYNCYGGIEQFDGEESWWGLSFGLYNWNSIDTMLMISHILFANDTLTVCGADLDKIQHLKGIFV